MFTGHFYVILCCTFQHTTILSLCYPLRLFTFKHIIHLIPCTYPGRTFQQVAPTEPRLSGIPVSRAGETRGIEVLPPYNITVYLRELLTVFMYSVGLFHIPSITLCCAGFSLYL